MGNTNPWAVVSQTPAPQQQPQQTPTQQTPAQQQDPWAVVSQSPAPPVQQPSPDTGVWAGVKRNTIGAVQGVYHALTDPVTPEESAQLLQKIQEHNSSPNVKIGASPKIPEASAQNPSSVALAYHRIVDLPADKLLEKGKDETEAARDLLEHHEYWKGGNLYMSGLADRVLSKVPLVGPTIGSIAERGEGSLIPAIDKKGEDVPVSDVPEERKDFSGAATDVASMIAAEHAPAVAGKIAGKVGEGLEDIAPKSMNSLLKANKESNYLYGKNPGKAFIDENIKLPKNSITFHGQLENLSGQLEHAQDSLNQQVRTELSKPEVANQKLDIVPTIRESITDAKKFISKQTGLDVPKYAEELNKLQDNLLTRFDEEGNPTGRLTKTDLSPADVADIKRSIGKNTDWRVNYADPDFKMKTYLNSIRKKIYGKLADTVEQAAPDSNIKELNGRLSNVIEAQGLLDKRLFAEQGTGGLGAAMRHGELLTALATLLTHGTTGEAGLATAGGLALDAARRTPIARLATAKAANAAGESLQSGVGQAVAQGAGKAALGAPVAAQLPEETENNQ